jgi:hypothetical protein
VYLYDLKMELRQLVTWIASEFSKVKLEWSKKVILTEKEGPDSSNALVPGEISEVDSYFQEDQKMVNPKVDSSGSTSSVVSQDRQSRLSRSFIASEGTCSFDTFFSCLYSIATFWISNANWRIFSRSRLCHDLQEYSSWYQLFSTVTRRISYLFWLV